MLLARSTTEFAEVITMARSGQRSFMKRQKEIERKKKAQEKMSRRQNKNKEIADVGKEQTAEPPEE